MAQHNCIECRHLRHTKPSQVFWRCDWWCSPLHGGSSYEWTVAHCHVQPEAPACHAFQPRGREVA